MARTAGVSSPLVYNYFSSRQLLLQELLQREYDVFSDYITEKTSTLTSFSEITRVFIGSNYDFHAPGNILPILQSQPDIVSAIKEKRSKNSKQTAKYLISIAAESYKLTKTQAELAITMSSGSSVAAAGYAASGDFDREEVIDSVLAYVLAGLEAVSKLPGK